MEHLFPVGLSALRHHSRPFEEGFSMQKPQQDTHCGLNASSASVNGHMSAQLCILKECACYFSQCHFVMLTNCFHCADTPLFFFYYFVWIYFYGTSIYIL